MNTYPLRFFGPGIIVDRDGQTVAMRSRKQLGLLVYLACEYHIAHGRETLLALFWPNETTSTALNNLRVTLSRLRQLANSLTHEGVIQTDLLISDRHNVQIEQAWIEHVDVNCFHRLLESTRQHAHTSRSQCEQCQTPLRQAVQFDQGLFLEGFSLEDCEVFEEWLFMQRERLRLLVIDAYSDLAIYAESNGDLRSARAFAQRQLELDPLREPAYRQQMRILSKLGERSAALALFERCRAIIRDELGLDPEVETLSLHVQILTGEGVAHLHPSSPIPANDGRNESTPRRHTLPLQLTPFIGREQELAQLQARLTNPAYRLLSIIGPGGIGKSRLAQQVAVQQSGVFGDGVYFVPLAQVATRDSIPTIIAESIGFAFVASQKSPAEQLIEMIGSKQLLLVLDNFEHLIDGTPLLLDLLRQSPNLVLLVTSRERLNLQAEDLYELQGLPTPVSVSEAATGDFAALHLFTERAQRLNKQFALNAEQLPYVVRICQLVEGFPLAIELAATWLRDLTCAEIVAELTAGLDRLESSQHDIDPQHRSLRAVFDSSWRLLSPNERRILAQLTVFRAGFSVDAARTIVNATPALLSGLRNKSLLRHAGSRRYDMHALVQQFSAETLASNPSDAALVNQAHRHYFLALLAEQAIALDTNQARYAADIIQRDWENVAVAWQAASAHEELGRLQDALDGLVRFCDLRGLFQEAQTLLESSITRIDAQPTRLERSDSEQTQRLHLLCRLQTALAYFAGRRGLDQTRALSQRALTLAEQIDSRPEIVSNLIIQATACELIADYPKASALAEKALGMARIAGNEVQVGLCLDVMGMIAYVSGDYARANELFLQVHSIHKKTGRIEQRDRAAIGHLGSVATEQDRYDVALHYIQLYLESCEAIDDRRNLAHALHHWAYLWLRLGDFEKAITFEEQSIARATILGDRETCSFALQIKAWAHRQMGQLPESLACARNAVALAQALDAQLALSFALGQLAETQMAMAQSEYEWAEAATTFDETATLLRAIGKVIMVYEAEIGLAELARRRGDFVTAQSLIEPILPHLPTLSAESWDEPIRDYVVCTEILRAVNDPRAELIHKQGLHLLECLAQRITEHTLRQNFIHAIPAHRTLRAL